MLKLLDIDLDKELLIELFRLGGMPDVTASKIKGWRTDLSNPRSTHMSDEALEAFVQGQFSYLDMILLDDPAED